MREVSIAGPRVLLCIGAHSDDIEIGAGGTIRKWVLAQGDLEVHWVVLAAHDQRREEAESSAARFLDGARAHVEIQGFRERYFPYLRELKEFFDDLGKRVSPDLVLTHRREDMHQDHRVVSEVTASTFRDHLIWEYEIPKYDGDLGQPNVYVDLSEHLVEFKVNALLDGFPSQAKRHWFTADTFRALLRVRGMEARALEGYAEAFTCRKMLVS